MTLKLLSYSLYVIKIFSLSVIKLIVPLQKYPTDTVNPSVTYCKHLIKATTNSGSGLMVGHIIARVIHQSTARFSSLSCAQLLNKRFPVRSPIQCLIPYRRYCSELSDTEIDSMDLSNVVKKLHKLAHPSLAGSWDNVGLLVEPSAPHKVNTILLTNDLTPPVLDEAISSKADLIISYHPPIFSTMKKLSQKQWKEKIIIRCIENRVAVFSPHTSYDCVEGGVNDWLISCFDCADVQPVEQHAEMPSHFTHTVKFSVPEDKVSTLQTAFKTQQNVEVKECITRSEGESSFNVHCNQSGLTQLMKILQNVASPSKLEISELAKAPKVGYGMGRKSKLKSPITLEDAVKKVKEHLKLDHIRLATSPDTKNISSVAVCAGSGSSVLRNVPVDLYLTGEMSHHEVLHAVCSGTSVILCDHSNTERGYLTVLKSKLQNSLNESTEIQISQVDCDPLKVV